MRKQVGVGGFQVGQRAKDLISEVLDSNRLTAGPKMADFERQIAELHDCRFCLMSNSGTSSLQVALGAMKERYGWADGDEVLVPALTFIASSNVILYNQLQPVFVDVDPEYYEIDPHEIERHLTPKTRAIMVVHIAGLPCDMHPIREIARQYNLRIIEDSAETMFARYHGEPVGSMGDIGCFSTYAAHVISTAIGGLSVTNNEELHEITKSLINHGRDTIYTRADDDRKAGANLFDIANRRFSFVRLGHSFRATELEAALGLAELEQYQESIARRREIAARYNTGLADLQEHLQLPVERPETDHVYMFYPLALNSPQVTRDSLIQFLEENSIETRYLLPLIRQPIYQQLFGDLAEKYPVAARLDLQAFYIGCHPELTDEDVDYVIERFHAFFAEV